MFEFVEFVGGQRLSQYCHPLDATSGATEMKSFEVGTIWHNVEKCKYGYQYWMKTENGWKFIGYNKDFSPFPTTSSMKRFMQKPHPKDIKDRSK